MIRIKGNFRTAVASIQQERTIDNMMCLNTRFIFLAILLVSMRASASPIPEPKELEAAVPATNEKQAEPAIFVLMDDDFADDPSEFFFLDTVFTEAKQTEMPASDAESASSDAKETGGSERIFFKKFVVPRPVAVPVPVMPVAFMRPPPPQVVRVPNTFYVVVGAQNPHVYALRPPHYRPTLISTGLSALTGGSVAGLSAHAGGSFAGLTALTGMPGLGVQRPQPALVESSLTAALPQPMPVPPPVFVQPQPQPQPMPSPSLISGMLSNLMSFGSKVPVAPVHPVPSMPVFSRPTVPPPTALNLQVQKVVDVMAHAKETVEKKEEE